MEKKYTSRILRLIAYGWIAFPLNYIAFAMIALGLNSAGIFRMILSPWYWILSGITALAGNGIRKIRWYGWYTFLFSHFLISYHTMLVLAYHSVGDAKFKFTAFGITMTLQFLTILVVAREVRVPYFFPRIRWWESDPRYKLSVQSKIFRKDAGEIEGEIMDISMGGCFVKTHGYFVPDEELELHFELFEKQLICVGRVVWRTESTVTHPKGIGIKFSALNKESSICLRQATRKLRKLARMYSQMSRERNWQEYIQREKRYQGKKNE